MKCVSVVFALAAGVTGFTAAYFWFKASKIPIDPGWGVEPGEVEAAHEGWITGTVKAVNESASLNKTAAIWTACSVVLGAASTLFSSLA